MESVAYITTTFPTLAWFLENEVHRLVRRGVRVRVLTLRPVGREYQPEHAPLAFLTRRIGNPLSPGAWAALAYWLIRRPQVLVPEAARMLWASRRSLYALAGHLAYLPAAAEAALLLEREDLQRVHGAWAHFPGSVAYLASRLTGRPLSLAGHAGGDLYRTQAFLAEKVRAAEFVTACVRSNAEMLQILGGPRARVEWIYHGVDLERFDGQGRRRDPEPLLLTVGRLAPTKGFGDAVRALSILGRRARAPRLVLVGDGPERGRLEALARELGVEARVWFAGSITREELLPFYRRAWLLVAPSVELKNGRRDGIPNVVTEAMAMGLPCVGTRAAGLEEAIVPGETGALCDPGDPESLADALERQLAHPEELDAMGSRARARVAQRFDTAPSFERLLSLFNQDGPGAGEPEVRAEAG